MNVELSIRDLRMAFRKDVSEYPMLASQSGGRLKVVVERPELESAVLAAVQWAVDGHQVRIESAELDITSNGDHDVSVNVRVRARKAVLSAVINVGARIRIGDDLVMTLGGLTCQGDGVVGKLVAMVMRQKMAGFEGTQYPLPARLHIPESLTFANPVIQVNGQDIQLVVEVRRPD